MKAEAFRDDLAAQAFAGIASVTSTSGTLPAGAELLCGRSAFEMPCEERIAAMDGATLFGIKPWAIRTDTAKNYANRSSYGDFVGHVRNSDAPGIAAMAAKRVQPAPEPVLSLAGEQGTAAEFAQALQLVRAKNAPVIKEAPRGLLTVAAMDHRLGRWNEA